MAINPEHRKKLEPVLNKLLAATREFLSVKFTDEIDLSLVNIGQPILVNNRVEIDREALLININFASQELGKAHIVFTLKEAIKLCSQDDSENWDDDKQDVLKGLLQAVFENLIDTYRLPKSEFFTEHIGIHLLDPAKSETLKVQHQQYNIGLTLKLQLANSFEANLFVDISQALFIALMDLNLQQQNSHDDESQVFDADFAQIADNHDPEDVNEKKNLNLLMDIKMGLIVELGRSEMHLRDILKLTKGSIIELDRLSGESVDLFVNNKLIARGEVVVIDDNFGLRITQLAGLHSSVGLGDVSLLSVDE